MTRSAFLVLSAHAFVRCQSQGLVEITLTDRPDEPWYPWHESAVFVRLTNTSNGMVGFSEVDPVDDYGIAVRRADGKKVKLTKEGSRRGLNRPTPKATGDIDNRSFRPLQLAPGESTVRWVELAGLVDLVPGTYVVELRQETKPELSSLWGPSGKRLLRAHRTERKILVVVDESGRIKQ